MFECLGKVLLAVLDEASVNAAFPGLYDTSFSFKTSEKGLAPRQGDLAINLFLYEVKENCELRQPMLDRDAVNGRGGRRHVPLTPLQVASDVIIQTTILNTQINQN
ncbi:MAG TPA: hypothetical protein PKV55_15300 [Nitrospira sp.]|nr:hypothetical protein [Nitrospira sp.]